MKLIILDRDGVINQDSDLYIKSPEEWIPLPGSLEAIARLNQWGYRVVVCTNQSGIGRGLYGMDTLNAIHDKMIKMASHAGGSIDAIFFCPHTNADNCDCRKPKAGMLKEIRLKPRIAAHDLDTKIKHVEEFLQKHDKVRVTVIFRGRENQHKDIGRGLLSSILERLASLAAAEGNIQTMGNRMSMTLIPKH